MPERLLVIGGDPGGMAAASQARRRRPDLEIVALEKGRWTSYSACGTPYVVGGEVGGLDQLVTRSPQMFRAGFRIDARTEQAAMAIDFDARSIEVRDHAHDRTYRLGFDKPHIRTRGRPRRPGPPRLRPAFVGGG